MFVGKGVKRISIENRDIPKYKERRNAKPATILKATVNKRDLRFLYNILYNDKNKKQNCKEYALSTKIDIQLFFFR